MKKAEFNKGVQEVLEGLGLEVNHKKATDVSDGIFELVVNYLTQGEEVPVGALGKFTTSERAARTARNIQTGEPIDVPAKTVPKFKPSKHLKETVNN